jgi:hypothetical protein
MHPVTANRTTAYRALHGFHPIAENVRVWL